MRKQPLHPFDYVRVARRSGLLLLFVCLSVGCTATQVTTVVQDIGIYAQQAEPILVALIPVITALKAGSGDPSSGAALNTFDTEATADLDALTALCKDYTAHPSTPVYAQIGRIVDKLVNESDVTLLQIMAIKDAGTRQQVQMAVASFDALIHTIDGFVQTTQSASTVAAKADGRAVKLRDVSRYWSQHDRSTVAQAFGSEFGLLLRAETGRGF